MTRAAFSCDIARSTFGSTTSPALRPGLPDARERIFSTTVAPTSALDGGERAADSALDALRQRARHGLAHRAARRGAAHVVRADLALGQNPRDGGLDGAGPRVLAEPVEHHLRGEDRRDRVYLVLARVLRRRAVCRLEDGELRPDVPRAAEPEAADHLRAEVGDDV